jgi:TRAP-type C4-dicarboxylate transport system substrate-binding protein
MALQRGTIDGAHSGMTSFWERKTYEVAKYVAQFDYSFGMMATVMNLKKWNELPSDIQKIFLDCSKEAQEWVRKEAEKMDKECVELLKGKGMEIYVVPEKEKERWRKTNQPSIDVFLKRAGENSKVLLELAEKVR